MKLLYQISKFGAPISAIGIPNVKIENQKKKKKRYIIYTNIVTIKIFVRTKVFIVTILV